MTDLEFLAMAIVYGNSSDGVTVMRQSPGIVRVVSSDREWIGSEAEWNAATLAAHSAKVIRGVIVLPARDGTSDTEISSALKSVPWKAGPVVILRPGWSALGRKEINEIMDRVEQSYADDEKRSREFERLVFGTHESS